MMSSVGRPKHQKVMAGAVDGDCFIGRNAQDLRGLLTLKYPLEHGAVTDWNDMERIWNYLYAEELKTLPEEHPVLLTEAPLNPKKNRDQAAQLLFETFNVPALFISIQAVLALYASGRTTGIVLDSGDGVTHAVPVYEGFAIPNAIKRIDVAGRDVTEYLQLLLRKAGYHLSTSAEMDIVRTIKEKACFVSLNPGKEEKEYLGRFDSFVLPDGNSIKVSCLLIKFIQFHWFNSVFWQIGVERFKAPEILFHPDIVGHECPGIHHMIADSIQRTDLDLRRNLYSNIILSGGTTLTKGFGDRLLHEMKRIALRDVKIKIYAPPERKYSTWIGGSILASLSTFKKMWVSAEEYQEDPDVIHKRLM